MPPQTIIETEIIELLLLQNRGLTDHPEILLFNAVLVAQVFAEILQAGYLRSLSMIPAMELYSTHAEQYIFSAAGRIRYYRLLRKLDESEQPDRTKVACGL